MGAVHDKRFEPLRTAFQAILSGHEGTSIRQAGAVTGGASLCVVVNGTVVLDLWAGDAGSAASSTSPATTAWQNGTAAYLFSATKGLAAVVVAVLAEQGHLDFDDPVRVYWPEFGAAGKADITIAQVMAHSAGLSALDRYPKLTPLQWATSAGEHLSKMHPVWLPGHKVGYSPWAVGTFVAELVPRADPKGRDVATFFEEEVATPLGVQRFMQLGRRKRNDTMHVARFRYATISTWIPALWRIPHAIRHATVPWSLSWRAFANPHGNPLDFNTREYQEANLPNTNGFATARALATLYGNLVSMKTGTVAPLLSSKTMQRAALTTHAQGFDQVMRVRTAFGVGFVRCSEYFPMGFMDPTGGGNCSHVFGHPGFGGAIAWADARTGIAAAFLTSVLDPAASARSVRFETLKSAFSNVLQSL